MHSLPLERNAVLSECGKYRYVLTRKIGPEAETATFIMLNPSTADATLDDPTIRRCIGFSGDWNCGRLIVLNLFALRATKPAVLKHADDPVGPENKAWFDRILGTPGLGLVVCAWGVHGTLVGQDLIVLGWLAALGVKPVALGLTKDGHPKHPLYVPYAATPLPFSGRKR